MSPALKGISAAALVAFAFAPHASSQTVSDPCPTLRRAPVEARVVPAQPCESSDVRAAFIYFCCTHVSVAAGSPRIRLDIVAWPDSCANVRCMPETLFVPLGRFAAGNHAFVAEYRTEWHEGGSACIAVTRDTLRFTVRTECPPPTGIRFLERVEIGRGNQQACPGDSIPVRLSGTLPDNCTAFERIEVIPSPILATAPFGAPPKLRIVFSAPTCLGRPCILGPVPWAATVKIPPLLPRDWQLPVEALAIDFCTSDTTRLGGNGFPFTVLTSCDPDPAGCLFPGWAHPVPGARCDALIGPDRPAQLTMTIGAAAPLAALQGRIVMQPLGLQVTKVEPVGPAAGMQLSWNHVPEGVRFVLFATDGAPIPGGTLPDSVRVPVLRLTFAPDPVAPTAPKTRVFPAELLGADSLGRAVYVCPTFAPIDASAFICLALACDFNGDGVADVRDLVRMVRCITGADPCDPAYTARFDCDSDGAFGLDDVLCCARTILGTAPVPGAGEAREATLHVTMGLPATVDGAIEIPVDISGNQAVAAARLTLGLPTTAFAQIGVRAEPGSADLAVHQVESGSVTVGLIRAGAPPSPGAPLRFTLRLTPQPGTTPVGEVTLVNADFSAPDGVRLIADPGEPIAILGEASRVVLGPARPNPFHDTQHIALVLPRGENADLAVFDLSGRRVRSLHHGPLPAGGHGFAWNGRDDGGVRLPGGVYFYRLAVDGIAVARRVVLLADPR